MESDDEYGRDPYRFIKNRDEFEDQAFSDDEVDAMKYPWSQHATQLRSQRFPDAENSD